MAKSNNMKDLLKQRMSAAQQVSEMEIGNRAYESLIDPLPAAASTIRELPVDKLRPFFTTDIGFHPYSPEKLRAFAQQLLEQGLLERIIVRSIPNSDEYEILAGHNRTAAWRMAGHDTIPAEVVAANDARAIIIATATNLLRRQELTIGCQQGGTGYRLPPARSAPDFGVYHPYPQRKRALFHAPAAQAD